MDEEKIIETLESIGLNKNEAIVYLDLIRVGKSSVMGVSERTKIHRSNTYDILEKLLEKGIVEQSIKNDKKFFYPVDVKNLLDYLKQKENKLKEIIPQIEKIQNKPKEEKRVTVSEGLNSVKNILLSLLDCKEPVFIYGTPKEAIEILGGFKQEFNNVRIKKKIPLKHIYGVDAIKRVRELNKMEYTEARYLPSSNSKISTNICGNKVVLILWDTPISAIIIESKAVAETYKAFFEILWDEARIEE